MTMTPASYRQIEAAVATRTAMEAHRHLGSLGLRASPQHCKIVKDDTRHLQRKGRVKRPIRACRADTPLMLVDQLVAWSMHRRGDVVSDIADRLRRRPTEARTILYGYEA